MSRDAEVRSMALGGVLGLRRADPYDVKLLVEEAMKPPPFPPKKSKWKQKKRAARGGKSNG